MSMMDAIDIIGLKDAIKKSFTSVFGELNVATETWFQKTKLLTISREKYADYLINKVGIFPLFATNRSASVDTSYVRVDISTDIERDRYRPKDVIEEGLRRHRRGKDSDEKRRITGMTPIESILSTSGGFALVGSPGSGKTTIFRSIAIQAARGKIIRGRKRIPIYLAVRDLASDNQSIIKASESLFSQLDINEAGRVLQSLLKSGNCIILLDGLDETTSNHQASLLNELLEIKSKNNGCIYCISARPASLTVGLADFTKWETLPLSFSERLLFVSKWFSVVDESKGERLIKRCKSRPEILDLGSSPLLLSIVCALFNNDLDIPSEPDELYDRAIHGLLGGWDAFRNIARHSILGDLTIRKRLVVVSWLAAAMFEEGKLVFSPADVNRANILQRVTEVLRIPALDADSLLPSLYNDFGLIIERSPNLYSFSHLTIHEYLVAKYIVDNRGEINLLKNYSYDQKWGEIIRLVAKMLPNADDFLTILHNTKSMENSNDLKLLESIWLSKPICSVELRKGMMKQLAKKVHGITSRYKDFRIDRTESGKVNILILIDTPSNIDNPIIDQRMRFLFPDFVMECLLTALRIIEASGFTYRDLEVHNSRLFKTLAEEKVCDIKGVRFYNLNTKQFVSLKKD